MSPLFTYLLALFPFFVVALILWSQSNDLEGLQQRFAAAARKEKIASERKLRKEFFLQRYSHPAPYFLDQEIESVPLLQSEREKLESLLNHPAFPESAPIKRRLEAIKKNKLCFAEEQIRKTNRVKEVEEKQRFPVQMEEADLKIVLSKIEDLPIDSYTPAENSPQMIIKDFEMKKQQTSLQNEIFEVEMNLIKREFIAP